MICRTMDYQQLLVIDTRLEAIQQTVEEAAEGINIVKSLVQPNYRTNRVSSFSDVG